MGFQKKEWKDRLVEFAGRRKITNVTTGTSQIVDVERAEGIESVEGSPFNAQVMNDMEERISEGFNEVNNNLSRVKTYVSDDGKLHFVDSEGADSALPFKKSNSLRLLVQRTINTHINIANSGSITLKVLSKTGGNPTLVIYGTDDPLNLTHTSNVTEIGSFDVIKIGDEKTINTGTVYPYLVLYDKYMTGTDGSGVVEITC